MVIVSGRAFRQHRRQREQLRRECDINVAATLFGGLHGEPEASVDPEGVRHGLTRVQHAALAPRTASASAGASASSAAEKNTSSKRER